MQEGDDYDSQGRWNALHQYGTEKIMLKNALAKEIDSRREMEEASKHSFRPEIIEYSTNQQNQADVVTRTGVWAQQIDAKKE